MMASAMWVSSAALARLAGSMARKSWDWPVSRRGSGGNLVRGEASGEHGGDHVEDEGEAGALPVADGEGSLGGFDGGGVAGEVACGVEAAVDREGLVALAVGGEGSVGELGHGHVEDDVAVCAWDGDDEGVVAEGGGGGSPGG